jgi:hypothetical protein
VASDLGIVRIVHDKSQPRPSNACTDTATDESIDFALKSNAPVDVLHRETGGSLEGPAELPVNISAGETRHTVDSVEAIAIHGSFDSAKQLKLATTTQNLTRVQMARKLTKLSLIFCPA